MKDLFAGLISSKTRIKLLVRFFFNPRTSSYLRELAKEFNVSTNSVREELNQLTRTDLLKSQKNGRQVLYTANQEHPLFPELKSMVGKLMGIDQVIDGIVNRLGDLERAYLIDDYAEGRDTGIIDLMLVGNIESRIFLKCLFLLTMSSQRNTRFFEFLETACQLVVLSS